MISAATQNKDRLSYTGHMIAENFKNKIIIYQKAFANYPPEKLPELITNVLQHEIGHYFGMSEEELDKYKKI